MSSFGIFTIVTMSAVIGHLLWSKRQAGSVLLKLGRSKLNKLFLGIGVSGIALAMWDPLEAAPVVDAVPLWGLFAGVWFILAGWSGLEIREAGIFSDGQLVKWERIEFYEWGEKRLYVRRKKQWFNWRTVSYAVPPHQKQAVNDLLARHVSGATAQVEVV